MSKSRFSAYRFHRLHLSRFGRIMVLTGARQVGKTTLLKKLYPNYQYISLDDPTNRHLFSNLTTNQWINEYPRAVLDEVQKEPKLMEIIKSAYDSSEKVRYILTGSSQLMLMSQVKESLAGRCIISELYPLTLPEVMTQSGDDKVELSLFQKMLKGDAIPSSILPLRLYSDYERRIKSYQHYLDFGGYPAISDDGLSSEERYLWLRNYLQTYLERDIRDLAEFKNLEPFVLIQKMSALLTGQLLSYTSLAKEAKVHLNTAKRYLQYMQMSYQSILLAPWHRNQLKRLSKVPKLHILDPGIQRVITGKVKGEMTGHEFESAIVAEMYKQVKYLDQDYSIFHLRTSDGREVDFLIETNEGYYAIEIKMTQNFRHTDARHLRNLEDILDKPLIHSFVISNDIIPHHLDNNITAIHAAAFLT